MISYEKQKIQLQTVIDELRWELNITQRHCRDHTKTYSESHTSMTDRTGDDGEDDCDDESALNDRDRRLIVRI